LEEESYFNKLKVRDLDDQIYNLNMLISAEQEKIDAKVRSMRVNTDAIRVLDEQILAINESSVKIAQDKIDKNDLAIARLDYEKTLVTETSDIVIANLKEEASVLAAVGKLEIEELKVMEEQFKQINDNTNAMIRFGRAGAAAYNAIQSGKFNFDSSSQASLRKSSTKDLQESLTGQLANIKAMGPSGLSAASFNIPSTSVGSKAVSGIMGNVTTNNMNNNVSVNATGASAVEVADIVIRRLDMERFRSIGGGS